MKSPVRQLWRVISYDTTPHATGPPNGWLRGRARLADDVRIQTNGIMQ